MDIPNGDISGGWSWEWEARDVSSQVILRDFNWPSPSPLPFFSPSPLLSLSPLFNFSQPRTPLYTSPSTFNTDSTSFSLESLGPFAWVGNKYDLWKSLKNLVLKLPDNAETIPDSIGEAKLLKFLTIRGNNLKSLPDSITRLPNLRVLELRDCSKLEHLPANLNELVSLAYLGIGGGTFESLPPAITGLRYLHTLSLRECFSLKELPVDLHELVNLRRLFIRGSKLKSLPNSITRLYNLQVLDLEECLSLKELPENLNELVSLSQLNIVSSNIKSLPNSITGLRNLEFLKLHNCYALQELPENLNELVSLTSLTIRDSNIKSISNCITGLCNLKTLDLQNCSSLKELPEILNELKRLTYLNIRGTNIKCLPYSITRLHNLKVLNLPECFGLEELPDNLDELVNMIPLSGQETLDEHDGMATFSGQVLAEADRQDKQTSAMRDEMEIMTTRNEDGIIPFDGEVTMESDSQVDDGRNLCDQSSHRASETGQMGIVDPDFEHVMAPFDEDVTAEAGPSEHGVNAIACGSSHLALENGERNRGKGITKQDIELCRSNKMTQEDAAKRFGVARSTIKRRCRELGIKSWKKRITESASGSRSSKLTLSTPSTRPAGCEHVTECLNASNQTLASDMLMRTAGNTTRATRSQIRPSAENTTTAMQNQMLCGHGNQNVWASKFAVKAEYYQNIVRFEFSSTSSFVQLKEEVTKRLNLEKCRMMRIKYLDDCNDYVLMNSDTELQDCLRISRSFLNNNVRLKIDNPDPAVFAELKAHMNRSWLESCRFEERCRRLAKRKKKKSRSLQKPKSLVNLDTNGSLGDVPDTNSAAMVEPVGHTLVDGTTKEGGGPQADLD